MTVKHLKIPGVWTFTPRQFEDDRGTFFEWFQEDVFRENSGLNLNLAQANCSISAPGTLRGLHFAAVPPGQRKYVTCMSGSAFDVVVDVRVGSPTFGKWESILLDTVDRTVVSIPNGVAHGFMALEQNTTVIYLCDERYNPANEYEIDPFDSELSIQWPNEITPLLSPKDQNAASFQDRTGHFPIYESS